MHLLLAAAGRGVPLDAARRLLPALRALHGPAAFDAALAPYRPALALTLAGLALDPAEQRAQDAVSAGVLGFLPNTGLGARPLLVAWAGLLAALLPPACTLVAPDPGAVDPGTLVALRIVLARRPAATRPRLLVGPHAAPVEVDPIALRLAELRDNAWAALGRYTLPLAGAPLGAAPPAGAAPAAGGWDVLDPHVDARADAALTRGDPDPALLLAGARAAFAAYGFTLALRLAEALLALDADHPDAAELHTLAAVAALHVAPARPAPGDAVAARIDPHLAAALAHERDPRRRAHLRFRRCIRAGRVARDVAGALHEGEVALAELDAAPIGEGWRAYLGGWCRNARAFARLRAGDAAGAVADCRAALAGVEAALDVPPVEVDVLRFHLANNLCRVAWEAGDAADARTWQRAALAVEARIPADRRTIYRWADPALDLEDLAAAAERTEATLADARAMGEGARVAEHLHDLGVIALRRGDGPAALAHHRAAADASAALEEGDPVSAAINVAVAAWRAGAYDLADTTIEALLQGDALPAAARAELHAGRARIAAEAGAPDRARACLAAAAAAVVATRGVAPTDPSDIDPESAARVARAAGEVWLALGDRPRALVAFDQALAGGPDAPPEDRLGALLGRLEAAALPDAALPDGTLLDDALACAPAALADPGAWAELPRLLGHVARRSPPPPAVAPLLLLARQRADCVALVDAITAALAAA